MKKRIGAFLIVLTMFVSLFCPNVTAQAASGKTTLAVSSSSLNIGDTVTVTAKAMTESGGTAVANMTLSYDTSVLEFVSCSASLYGGGGGGSVTVVGMESFSVTLKAVSPGSGRVSLAASDGVDFDATVELDSMAGSSTSITVNNAASNNGGSSGNSGGGTGNNGGTTSNNGGTTTNNGGDNNNGGSTTANLSADNSLKTLTISPGTLSPAFKGSTTNYTATVANDVTSIAVSAEPVNANASVESVTGNTNLAVGENTIKVVVKAENGTLATYKIVVTRLEAGEETGTTTEPSEDDGEGETTTVSEDDVLVNNMYYRISGDFSETDLPVDFVEATVNYHGKEYKGASFTKGTLSLLYLTDPGVSEGTGSFFIYDETRDAFYNFARMSFGTSYVIALQAPVDVTIPDNYFQTSFTLADGTTTVTAYQPMTEEETVNEFYLFYGVNHNGVEGWYQYDTAEGTYQRSVEAFADVEEDSDTDTTYLQDSYNTLSEKYKKEKSFSRNVMAILGLTVAVLIIIIINMLVFRRGKNDEFDGEEYEDEDDGNIVDEAFAEENDEDVSVEEEKSKTGLFGRRKKKWKSDDLDELDDEDTFSDSDEAEEEIVEKENVEEKKNVQRVETPKKSVEVSESNVADVEVLDLNDL